MKILLVAWGHMTICIFSIWVGLQIHLHFGLAVAGALQGVWIANSLDWKRKCEFLEERVEDLIDVNKVLERRNDEVVPFVLPPDGTIIIKPKPERTWMGKQKPTTPRPPPPKGQNPKGGE